MHAVTNYCGTVCCFAGAIMIEKLGVKKANAIRSYERTANRILGVSRNNKASRIFSGVYDGDLWHFTDRERYIYHSGHRTRALRMAVARTMETEV